MEIRQEEIGGPVDSIKILRGNIILATFIDSLPLVTLIPALLFNNYKNQNQ